MDYNAYQTVKFTNIYRKPYELTVIKRDAESGSGIAGMTFELELKNNSGGTIVELAGITAVDGSLVFKLDAVGLQPGEFYSFKLTEKSAEGYKTPLIVEGRLLAAEGNLRIEPDSLTASCDGESTSVEAEASSSILYVKNQSKNTVSLKVVKEWIGDQRDQVTVRLLRNGSPILTDVVLKAETGSSDGWRLNAALNLKIIGQEKYTNLQFKDPMIQEWDRVWTESVNTYSTVYDLTADEEMEIAAIMNDISTYVQEQTIKAIIDADALANWDKTVEQIKNMRLNDALAIYQEGYNRYNNR